MEQPQQQPAPGFGAHLLVGPLKGLGSDATGHDDQPWLEEAMSPQEKQESYRKYSDVGYDADSFEVYELYVQVIT